MLEGAEAITCRPADLLESELDKLTSELRALAVEKGITLADNEIDDVLTYALFPQIGLKFLENRSNPAAFEPAPSGYEAAATASSGEPEVYTVSVNGKEFVVQVAEGGDITGISQLGGSAAAGTSSAAAPVAAAGGGEPQKAALAGNIFKVLAQPGDQVEEGELVLILEAMKMETEVRAFRSGAIGSVNVKPGDAVSVGDTLLTIG